MCDRNQPNFTCPVEVNIICRENKNSIWMFCHRFTKIVNAPYLRKARCPQRLKGTMTFPYWVQNKGNCCRDETEIVMYLLDKWVFTPKYKVETYSSLHWISLRTIQLYLRFIYHFSKLATDNLGYFWKEDKDQFNMHIQYNCCWCRGDLRSHASTTIIFPSCLWIFRYQ